MHESYTQRGFLPCGIVDNYVDIFGVMPARCENEFTVSNIQHQSPISYSPLIKCQKKHCATKASAASFHIKQIDYSLTLCLCPSAALPSTSTLLTQYRRLLNPSSNRYPYLGYGHRVNKSCSSLPCQVLGLEPISFCTHSSLYTVFK